MKRATLNKKHGLIQIVSANDNKHVQIILKLETIAISYSKTRINSKAPEQHWATNEEENKI